MKLQLNILLFLLFSVTISLAQRRAAIEHVNTGNKIKGEPYLILPKTAVRMEFSLFAYTYKAGSRLKDLVKLNDTACSDDKLKKELNILEKRYDINLDVLIKLLRQQKIKKDSNSLIVYKFDTDIKTSFISMADYDKVYKYIRIRKRALNSNLLNLQYDENGVLVSSKQTSESKVFPAILNTISGLVSIGGAIRGSGASTMGITNIDSPCVTINKDLLKELDSVILDYNTSSKNYFIVANQFEDFNKKSQEAISKLMEKLFYSKEVELTPLQITFAIPGGENDGPTLGVEKSFDLFSFDITTHQVIVNPAYQKNILFTPSDRFKYGTVKDPVKIILSTVESPYDKSVNMTSLMEFGQRKKTAVYNIPKTERFRLQSSGSTSAYIDTTIKVPQHGPIGYFSIRLNSLELTYDSNGELKSIAAENKSSADTNISSGAAVLKEVITFAKGKSEMDLLKEKADKLELEKKIRDLENDPNK